ncbi:DUF4347 domain-containing protein [Burkholderia plantarii]|uniref:DUF4347 domain-containing protein n=3 Tax=Burkholderia plantarii TaxID=41899 RepID=UPI0006D8A5EB|nr:DUF4347 domain-containing protein [Burkholderia plantarii]ALK33583.1 fibronectin type III domain-containing protein [Burkholderia plantarii]
MKIVKQWFARQQQSANRPGPRVAASPLLLALEPRVVYDASVAAIAAQPHAHEHAHADTHRSTESQTDTASANATQNAPVDKPVRGASRAASDPTSTAAAAQNQQQAQQDTQHTNANDVSVAMPAARTQVVFIDPSVANYQTLIAGLAAGTQYVVLDASTDGFAQIAQYLQSHHGVDSIALISHGTDGAIQAGSTWLTASDLSAYSAQLAQIGAAMKAGGDFLIYGCDVARQADGQALVQQIAGITHLNVAASTDATGAASLGGNWTLEYQAGNVHSTLNESASAEAQFNELLGVTVETYDTAANNNFQALGSSQFTLDGIVYTLDQAANTFAYNDSNAPNGPTDITDSQTDGVLEINADGASAMSNVTISLANGHTFNLQSFDLSSFNGDLYIQAHYANGTSSALIQLATAAVGGFPGATVSSQLGSAFNNIVSFSLIDQNDSGAFEPSLDNLTYQDTGPTVTTSSGSAAWSSADNGTGTGGNAVPVDPGLTLSDGSSSTAKTATVQITNVQAGDVLNFTAQNGISGVYNTSTGTLTLSTGAGTATLAQWQAALESVTFSSSLTSPTLSTTTRSISFSFNDGTFTSNIATRNVTITATDQTPVLAEGGATSTNYLAGTAAATVDANIHVSDADNASLATATITIASGFASGDSLGFTNNNSTLYGDIQASYNPSTHVLSLFSGSGAATVAQWQSALDAVTFASSSTTTSGTRDLTFVVNDGTKTSAALHHSVVVAVGPTVTTDGGTAAFVTGDNAPSTPVVVDAGVTISDGTSTTLASATIQITSNFQVNHDQLLFSNNPATMGDISAIYNTGTGLLTLTSASGTASLAQWQAALRAVTFTSDLVVPSNATRVLTFRINDGTLVSPAATRNISVTDTDQTPIIGGGGVTASFVAGDNTNSTPVVVDNTITVADADGGPLHTATVTITGNYQSTDFLSFSNDNTVLYGDIQASISNNVLTLISPTGTATLAQWQAALRAVTYTSTAVTPSNVPRTVTFSISDGVKTSTTVTDTVNVADTDQTPLISGTSGTVTLTQGDNTSSTPVTVDSGIVVSDLDNATLASATVAISNFQDPSDVLLFVGNPSTMGNISSSYSNGVLTLTSLNSTATVAQWQAALRSIQFQNFSAAPTTTPRVVTFVISDGTKTSSVWSRTVDVALTDQTPLLGTSGGTTTFTAADNAPSTPVAIDTHITLTDSDSGTMASAAVQITGNYVGGEDLLALGSGSFGNITASFDGNSGTLTLTSAGASATLAQWQAALRSVTYTDLAAVPTRTTRTISFAVNDGTKTSATETKSLSVVATHQTPVLTSGSSTSQNFLPGNSATTIDGSLALTDLNVGSPSALVSLTITVQITSGFESGDILAFSGLGQIPVNGISPSYDPATGTLTITSTGGTLAQWQSVLDNLQFETGSSAPLGTRAISITISDGVKTSAPVSYSIDVISSAPALATTSTGSVSFVAGDNAPAAPVAIDANIAVADPLGNVVDTAIIAITGNLHSGEDVLGFTNDGTTMGDISGVYNTLTGVLVLTSSSGTATLAQWQSALRAVLYTDTSVTPITATRTIDITLSAGAQTSNTLVRTITVADTDQTPLISTSNGGAVSFVAADNDISTPVTIDNSITLLDLDNNTLASATVRIGAGFQFGEDVLTFVNDGHTMGNITASYDAATGTLTLTSATASATLAQWQAALRAVTYTDTAVTPDTTTRTISFTVSDGTKTSAAYTRNVTVADTDQTPIMSTTSTSPASFTAGDNVTSTPVAIDSGIVVSDLDNGTLASATFQIGAGFHAGEDVLSFVNNGLTMGNISANYDAATGTLTLTSAGASATLAQWQAALRAVTYTDTAITPDTATRTVSYSISDGSKSSPALTRNITVADTDQTPIVGSSNTGSASFVSADNTASTPVAVDNGITLSDLDNGTMASATVQIGAGFHAGEDVLVFVNDGLTMGNISASYDAATGTLTLTSATASATIAQWQAALSAVTYTNTAVAPDAATRTIGFSISDGTKTSAVYTRDVTVAATDQTPILTTGSTGSVPFTAGDNVTSTPVAIDSGIVVSDLDNGTLASATFQIGAGFHAGEDVLGFINDGTMGNISANYDAATGTLTLTSQHASATLAQWQAALRAVTYTDTAVTPDTATRTISFSINDGTKSSTALTRNITVADTDQTPIVGSTNSGDAAFVSGDNTASTPIAVDNGITLSDLDNGTLASATVQIGAGFHAGEDVLAFNNDGTMGNITGSYDAATGTLTLTSQHASATLAQWQAALRAVTYLDTAVTPDTTTRTIDFTVSDGTKTSATYSRDIDITANDQTPILTTGSTGSVPFTAGDNVASTPVAIDTGITLSDLDNGTLASATFQIGAGFHAGEDVLGFINDGTMGNISANYDAATGTLTLTSQHASATLAQWQAALRAVTYTDTAVTPDTATRTISFSINDGTKSSTALTRNITVADTDQTPIVGSTNSGDAAFVSGDNTASTPIAVDNGITLSDLDNGTLASATVQIGAGFHAGEDVLAFNNDGTMGNITGSYDAATGTLTLTSQHASATLAQWQAALRAVTYLDTAVTPDTTTRTIDFTISDGTKSSATYSRDIDITATDQTTLVSSSSTGPVSFVAADNTASTPVVVDNGITLSDLDNGTLASATVQVGTGFHAGEDVLGFINDGTMGNISASYDAATGTLTLTSQHASATLAQWQAALRAVTYTDTAVTPDTATRTISFTVNDGAKSSTAISRDVSITDTEQTPTMSTGSTGPAAFVSGDNTTSTPIAVDAGIIVGDRDNGTLASATVQIGAGFHAGEDVLAFVNDGATMGNITASYDAATGTLTLSSANSTATLAQWQAALRSVTYTDTAVTPDTTTRTIDFTVSDDTKTSAAHTRQVTVTATHQTPMLSGGDATLSYTADGKSSVAVGAGITLTDRNGTPPTLATVSIGTGFDPLHDVLAFNASAATGDITASYNAATGTLTLQSAGGAASVDQWQAALAAVTYRDNHIEGKAGSRTLIFTIGDGTATSAPLTRSLQIQAGQDQVGTPILPWPQPRRIEPPIIAPPPLFTGRANPLIVADVNGHSDGVSNPTIVLNELDAPRGLGLIPSRTTFTFGTHGAREDSLGDTHVSALDSIVPRGVEGAPPVPRALPAADVHPLRQGDSRFALRVAPLLQAPAGPDAGHAGTSVAVTLPDGAPLPAWLHYDAARGVLSGTPPAGVHSVHVTLLVRDAAGNVTRREVTVRFDAPAAHAPRDPGHGHDAAKPAARGAQAPAAPHAALPPAKASLAAQFASAHAALHVARHDAAPSDAIHATTERRS